jgi:hypothetical protein
LDETIGGDSGEAKAIAIASYRRVVEDGPEIWSSESAVEYSEHGEEYSDSEMYTTDMIDETSEPVLAGAMMTQEQAELVRNEGRAEGQRTVSGAG